MVKYSFSNAIGQTVSLDKIDQLVCDRFGVICSPTTYSHHYNVMVWTGIAATLHGDFDLEAFNKCFPEDGSNDKEKAIYLEFLHGTYKFTSWA